MKFQVKFYQAPYLTPSVNATFSYLILFLVEYLFPIQDVLSQNGAISHGIAQTF